MNDQIKKGVNSLNIRKMFTQAELKAIASSENVQVCRIIGKVTELEADKGQYGDYYNLFGDFEAWNLQTGEVLGARKCNLPGLAEAEIVAQYQILKEKAKKGESVEIHFGFDFSVMPNDKKESVGYEFASAPLMKQTVDPLAALRKSLPPMPKIPIKLAAPKREDLETA